MSSWLRTSYCMSRRLNLRSSLQTSCLILSKVIGHSCRLSLSKLRILLMRCLLLGCHLIYSWRNNRPLLLKWKLTHARHHPQSFKWILITWAYRRNLLQGKEQLLSMILILLNFKAHHFCKRKWLTLRTWMVTTLLTMSIHPKGRL